MRQYLISEEGRLAKTPYTPHSVFFSRLPVFPGAKYPLMAPGSPAAPFSILLTVTSVT